ncbi:hypothetical protein ACLKA6_001403 [Drosophila palustris]
MGFDPIMLRALNISTSRLGHIASNSFFGRTYNNIAAIAGCKHNGDCVINKKNRTACKACRLRKCLLVGMSKSGSRYGRRSNWFKIHCLLQEQQGGGASPGSGSVSNASLDQLARLQQASNQARQTYQDKTNPCIKSATAATPPSSIASLQQTTAAAAAATGTPSPSLPGFLQAAKYLNEQQQRQLKLESRLSNTPSDSGASSAGDPTDDGTSVLSATTSSIRQVLRQSHSTYAGSSEADIAEQQQRRHKELLDIFRSHSEPLYSSLTPFTLPPALVGSSLPPLPIFKDQFKSELLFPFPAASPAEEEEPIDLSLRSRTDTDVSPVTNSSNSPLSESANLPSASSSSSASASASSSTFVRKSTPLDLTLVRSQTLTG